jgi:hypothetical protein
MLYDSETDMDRSQSQETSRGIAKLADAKASMGSRWAIARYHLGGRRSSVAISGTSSHERARKPVPGTGAGLLKSFRQLWPAYHLDARPAVGFQSIPYEFYTPTGRDSLSILYNDPIQIDALIRDFPKRWWEHRGVRPHARVDSDEFRFLASCSFHPRLGQHGRWSGLHRRLLPHLKESTGIYVTAVITALLFVYLGTTLVPPEWC